MLNGGIEFAFDAGDGLKQELAEVRKGGGSLMGDALFGESGEDFAEDVVYVRDRVELAGKRGELRGQLFGFKTLLLFACVMDAKGSMTLFAEHAAGAAVGKLAETLVAVWIVGG